MGTGLCAPGGTDSSMEQRSSEIVTIKEPGYYRIGEGVCTIESLDNKVTIVSSSEMFSLHEGSTYASSGGKSEELQWIQITPEMLAGGPLQFEVSCVGDVPDDQLLPRDTAKENAVVAAVEQACSGVSSQAAMLLE